MLREKVHTIISYSKISIMDIRPTPPPSHSPPSNHRPWTSVDPPQSTWGGEDVRTVFIQTGYSRLLTPVPRSSRSSTGTDSRLLTECKSPHEGPRDRDLYKGVISGDTSELRYRVELEVQGSITGNRVMWKNGRNVPTPIDKICRLFKTTVGTYDYCVNFFP